MLHVYAMCGVAFSGKSTLARRIAGQLFIPLISLDAINHAVVFKSGVGRFLRQQVGDRSVGRRIAATSGASG
jgi:hypothetical protein